MILGFVKLGLFLQIRVLENTPFPEKSEVFVVFKVGFPSSPRLRRDWRKLALFGFVPFLVFGCKAL